MVAPPGGLALAPRSFAVAVVARCKATAPSIPIHAPTSTDEGVPTVFFIKEEIGISMEAMKHVIIAKTKYGRPVIPEIKTFLKARLNLEEDFSIGALDNKHLLLRFSTFDDYLRVLLCESLYVKGRLFKFFKYTMKFNLNEDHVVLPTWIELPGLPANFFADSFVRSIAGNIGVVL